MKSPYHLLQELGLKAKKTLGQNFLINENTAIKIIKFANPKPNESVLEIGPGLGALTHLLVKNNNVLAIEKDVKLFEFLKHQSYERLTLLNDDALTFQYDELKRNKPINVISNLPYVVSTPLMDKLFSHLHLFSSMTFLLQDELVLRMSAQKNTKAYGRLSIGIKLFCDVIKGDKISPHQFFPSPKVDSRLVKLIPKEKPLIEFKNAKPFLNFVTYLFSQRRKMLKSSLKRIQKDLTGLDQTLLDLRPENLDICDFALLYRHCSNINYFNVVD